MATIKTDLICNLNQPVNVTYLHGNLFSQDNAGNTINVFVLDNGEPATIGGTVSANVIRSDGQTVAVSGAIEGNRAYVILPQACYAVPGVVHIIIKLTQSTTVTTIAAIVANVYMSTTDAVIDPGTVIPSIQALMALIEEAVDSIPTDYTGLLHTIAADYSSSKTYKVGDYAWESGVLKRCIVPITAAETYTAAHWTNAVIGDDLTNLKSALTQYTGNSKYTDFHKDKAVYPSTPDEYSTAPSWESDIIPCSSGDVFQVKGYGGNTTRLWFFVNSQGTTLAQADANLHTSSFVTIIAPNNAVNLCVNSKYTEIPLDVIYGSFLRDEIASTNNDIVKVNEKIRVTNDAINGNIKGYDNGKMFFDAPFIHGTLKAADGSILYSGYDNRIVSETYFQFPYDLPLIIEDDFEYILSIYNAQHVQTGYTSLAVNYTIPANTIFRVSIKRVNSIVGEIADIEVFREKLYYVSNTENRLTEINNMAESADNIIKNEFITNIFNKNAEYVPDRYTTPTGTTATLAGWGYIDVNVISGAKLSCYSNNHRVMTCFYNGTVVKAGGADNNPSWSEVITIPNDVNKIRISCDVNYFPDIMLAYSDELISAVYPYGEFVPSINLSKYWEGGQINVTSTGSILQGMMDAYANGYKKVVVEAGEYDIISEYKTKYGNDCFDNYSSSSASDYNNAVMGVYGRGIWLENIEIVFNPGASVLCNYTGNNSKVKTMFSAFATGNNVIIDGLKLNATEVRYGIHADFNEGRELTYFKMRNCDLYHHRNSAPCQSIGAGLGVHVRWEFDNIIFRTDENKICFRIHNNVASDAQSWVYVRNCYVIGQGYMQFNSYSTSTDETSVLVSGCSWVNPVVNGKETEQSEDNVVVYAFANETRQQ